MSLEDKFWDNVSQAKQVIERINCLKEWTIPFQEIEKRLENIKFFLDNEDNLEETSLLSDLVRELEIASEQLLKLETKSMLSGPVDSNSCFVSINAGAGGTESCDWVEMLTRMYWRWAEKKGWTVEELDRLNGEIAGIKNITLKFSGPFAYGYTKAEKGVHRLVRISPFDSNAKRHTSFASVDVSPDIDDTIVIDIKPADIRIDTYRSSGAGGQHVNVTDSAVRITHLSTGIVVSCQNERSQLQNKESCFKMLRSKLYEKELKERQENLNLERGKKADIAWGSQIRNYVFQPYTLVKDTRTGFEVGNVEAMLNGDLLDEFIEAYLKEFGERE